MIMIVFLANNIANQLYKMEQRLVESLDKLHAAEVEKQKYIMGVVHEIKSPLTAVHSYLDVVLEDFLGPINDKIRERLMRTRSRSEEAIQMINDVLKISKLRLLDEISFDEVKIGEIITSIIRKNSAAISSKQISLKFEDRRDDRLPLKGDPVLLELAFSNLIGNAVKYVGHNGKVSVILETIPKGVQVEICDNGIGIPPKDLDKIFKDFYRASNIKQSGYEGSGLGLSIVKQIIERHGGNVKVESPSKFGSEDKPGSSFIISLPVEEIA